MMFQVKSFCIQQRVRDWPQRLLPHELTSVSTIPDVGPGCLHQDELTVCLQDYLETYKHIGIESTCQRWFLVMIFRERFVFARTPIRKLILNVFLATGNGIKICKCQMPMKPPQKQTPKTLCTWKIRLGRLSCLSWGWLFVSGCIEMICMSEQVDSTGSQRGVFLGFPEHELFFQFADPGDISI